MAPVPALLSRAPGAARLLTFAASGERFAVELRHVVEVLRMVAPTPLSGASADLFGVVDYRGTVVPLLDLAARLGLPRQVPGLDSKIVVVATRTGPLGLVVGEVDGLVSATPGEYSRRDALPISDSTRAATLAAGALRLPESLVLVLEPDRLLREDERGPVEETR